MGADAWPTERPRGCRRHRDDVVAAVGLARPGACALGPEAGPVRPADAAPRRAGFGSVFAVREFRALWGSVVLSATGDRLALVALAVLVYGRTGSPLLAAVAFAAGYLPWLAGGVFLSRLADRWPRRAVMVGCDALRAVLVAAMTVPGVPLGVLIGLLFAATLFSPPFEAARSALLPDVLAGERYVLGAAVIQTTYLTAEVAGAAAGGVAVAVAGVRAALVIDAATFAASGLLIGLGTRARPAPGPSAEETVPPLAGAVAGVRLLFGDRPLRTLAGFGWLVAFYAVPQGVAAPYAAARGGGPAAAGLVLASTAAATAVGTPLFARFVRPRRRAALMGPLAALACGTLALTGFGPGLAGSLVIFSASAAFGSYQIAVNTAFVARVPAAQRAQAFGIAAAGVVVGQGAGFILAGAAAELVSPATVIAAAGVLGAVTAIALTRSWRQAEPARGRHAARRGPGGAAGARPAAGRVPADTRRLVT
jgi:MFS family permease